MSRWNGKPPEAHSGAKWHWLRESFDLTHDGDLIPHLWHPSEERWDRLTQDEAAEAFTYWAPCKPPKRPFIGHRTVVLLDGHPFTTEREYDRHRAAHAYKAVAQGKLDAAWDRQIEDHLNAMIGWASRD